MKKLLSGISGFTLFLSLAAWVIPPSNGQIGNFSPELPQVGELCLHILSPTLLEIACVNTKALNPSGVATWNFIDGTGTPHLPVATEFVVNIGGQAVPVTNVGFKRRPIYAPLSHRDLRIDNRLYLQLGLPVADSETVAVSNPAGTLWSTNVSLTAISSPLRESAVIHINQEGYAPSLPKKAMLGYYLGSLGEMDLPAGASFSLVDTMTGASVFTGSLQPRLDIGYVYLPTPYQRVLEADFSTFSTPGEYQLQVGGLGASLPFLITEGLPMNFARTYALGLYHQRCGAANALPYTRHTHEFCHVAPAQVPSPAASFTAAWSTIASVSADYASNPRHTAAQLSNEATQLYPFVRTGVIDVSGGHHDAGDYSKYTINSAQLINALTFAVDAFPGCASLDNLGLPESGDGKSDLLQEAKWEADFLAKMQDSDGGFYFLVYPRNRRYENDVLPDHGDTQIVWPKNTAATAAAVAALAQLSSSPTFRQQFPAEAALYFQKAQLGWSFLTAAIQAHGKDGSYQKLTHYGDVFMHDDELAWAACEMFLATGDASYEQQLIAWYDPAAASTLKWTWWRCFEGYGCAARSYAFAARSGRLPASQLDSAYLAKCAAQVLAAGEDGLTRSQASAYGTAFELESKRIQVGGWYFSADRAFDITAAYQLDPKPAYLDAILTNLNYEAGCNPVNVPYLTGLGARRQHETVNQYAQNDRRSLPPSGLPLGNIQTGFAYLNNYGTELTALTYPADAATTAPYPYYDRWADSYNVTTEAVVVNQARGLACVAALAAQSALVQQPWNSAMALITAPPGYVPVNEPVTVTLHTESLELTGAEVIWEAQGQEPFLGGASYTFTPSTVGVQWVEAEAALPDGRRVFAKGSVSTCLQGNESDLAADASTLALYHFDSDFQDASGHGAHLTASGNVALASDNSGWRSNATGKVARFTGLGDQLRVQIADSQVLPSAAPLTIEARIYPRAYGAYGVSNFPVVSFVQDWDTGLELKDGKWNSPKAPSVLAGNSTMVTSAQWSSAVMLNAWNKLRLTYAPGGPAQCFINDVLVSTSPATGFNPARTNPWTLTLGNFTGDLDEVRVSSVVRP